MLTLDPIVKVNVNVNAATRVSNIYDVGVIMGDSETISASDRFAEFSDMTEVGARFDDESPEYLAAQAYFSAVPTPEKLVICRINSGETAGAALLDLANKTGTWYGVYLTKPNESSIKSVDAALKALNRGMQFYAFSGTAGAAVASNSLINVMFKEGSRRALGIVQAVETAHDAAAVMGTAMGLAGAHPNDAFALAYKTIPGIDPLAATQSEIDAIKEINGNVYVTRGYSRNLFEIGATASGMRYDEVLYIDSISADMQDRCIGLIADAQTKLPQNDTTSAIFINALTGLLNSYTNRGVLDSGVWNGAPVGGLQTGDTLSRGYYLYCASYDEQSQADREAHKAMPIYACICLAGSVESLEITLNVQQ